MHRLISAKGIYQGSIHGISLPHNSLKNINAAYLKCSFCQKILLTSKNPGTVAIISSLHNIELKYLS